jgi:AcrR family transcriptional regulator
MRAVAYEAGVSPGAIYRHFSGKRQLLESVCHAALEEFEARVLHAIARFAPGSFDRVIAQGGEYIRFALEKPEQFKILFTPVEARPRKLKDLPGQGGFRLLRQSLADAMEAGSIRKGDPDLAAFFLWSRVHGIITLLMACDFSESLPVPRNELTPARLFELSREFLWEGFKPTESASPSGGDAT